ncbi:10330_t:CDS:1, partial [Acaulospora morrowiae]
GFVPVLPRRKATGGSSSSIAQGSTLLAPLSPDTGEPSSPGVGTAIIS